MRHLIGDLLGPQSWGIGGNLLAQALVTLPALWWHRRATHRRLDRLEAKVTKRPSDDLENPGADSGPG